MPIHLHAFFFSCSQHSATLKLISASRCNDLFCDLTSVIHFLKLSTCLSYHSDRCASASVRVCVCVGWIDSLAIIFFFAFPIVYELLRILLNWIDAVGSSKSENSIPYQAHISYFDFWNAIKWHLWRTWDAIWLNSFIYLYSFIYEMFP